MKNVLQVVILDNENIENIHTEIIAIWKSPGQHRHDKIQTDRYVIQHILGESITLAAGPRILSLQAKNEPPPIKTLDKKPYNVKIGLIMLTLTNY